MGKSTKVGNYTLGKTIGEGSWGVVKFATDNDSAAPFAVKIIPKKRFRNKLLEQAIMREVDIMKQFDSPYFVHFHELITTKSHMYLVMELCTGGELFDKIVDVRRFPEDTARKYFQQLMLGVRYCHNQGIVHRDLKPENLLLDENDNLKITDFGFSARIKAESGQNSMLSTQCGTIHYAAPEVLTVGSYDGQKSDLWSCGIILYVMLVGYLPFMDDNEMELIKKITTRSMKFAKYITAEAKVVIEGLLTLNPANRMSMDDLWVNEWFAQGLDEIETDQEREMALLSKEKALNVTDDSVILESELDFEIPSPKSNSVDNDQCNDGIHCNTPELNSGNSSSNSTSAITLKVVEPLEKEQQMSKSPGRISQMLSSIGKRRRSSLTVDVHFNGEIIEGGLESSSSEAAVDDGMSKFNDLNLDSPSSEDMGTSPVKAKLMNKFRSRYNSSAEIMTKDSIEEIMQGKAPMSPVAQFRKRNMVESNRKRFSQQDLEDVLKISEEWGSDSESDDEGNYDEEGEKKPEPIALNAFELVNLLTSLNLSSMAIRGPDSVKRVTCFLSTETPRTILDKISDTLDQLLIQYIARYGLFQVKAVYANNQSETVVFVFQIYEICPGLHMVEINRRRGPILLFHALYKEIIEELEDLVIKRKVSLDNLRRASVNENKTDVTAEMTPETPIQESLDGSDGEPVVQIDDEDDVMFVLET